MKSYATPFPASASGRRKAVAATAAVLLTATLLGSASTMSPAAAAAPQGCYAKSGVSGYVTDEAGQPVAGAPVIVHAETDRKAKVGSRHTVPLVGWVRTDENGCYRVGIRATDALTKSADKFGVVNLRVTLQRSQSLEVVTYPKRLVEHRGRVQLRPIQTPDSAAPGRFRVSRVVAGADVTGAIHQSFGPQATASRKAAVERATTASGPAAATMTPATDASSAGVEPTVGRLDLDTDQPLLRSDETLSKVFKKHPVIVGQWWSQMKGVKQTWAFSQGASSELQSAVKVSSAGGSYEKSTTYAKSTDSTVTFPLSQGKTQSLFKSYFKYAKYIVWYCDASVGCTPWTTRIKPYAWERGTKISNAGTPGTPASGDCSHYEKGSGDTSRGSKALTWTNGVTIGGDLKASLGATISLSSRTGFTEVAENRVTFSRAGYLCGLFGPLSKPGALLARSKR
jgi:hypothetical protein